MLRDQVAIAAARAQPECEGDVLPEQAWEGRRVVVVEVSGAHGRAVQIAASLTDFRGVYWSRHFKTLQNSPNDALKRCLRGGDFWTLLRDS